MLASLGDSIPHGIRSYDPIREKEAFSSLDNNSFGLPTTRIIRNQMKITNPNIRTIIIPECIDMRKPLQTEVDKLRDDLKIDASDIKILQPTRTDQRKRTDRGLNLAVRLETFLPNKKVHYIVAATSKKPEDQVVLAQLNQIATQNNFSGLHVFDSIPPDKMNLYISLATFTTFMSEYEGWGRIPAESALLEKMCVTSRYVNTEGEMVFDSEYCGFKLIHEDDPFDSGISNTTIGNVLQYIHNPESFKGIIQSNYIKAQQFTPTALKIKLANTISNIFNYEK